MTGYYDLYRDSRLQWRWRYIASNGRIIADSAEGYVNRADAERGIAIMKASYTSPTRG